MNKYLSGFAVVIAMVIASPSFAAVTFNSIDADEDGFITLDEAKMNAPLSSLFSVLDVDEDAKLSVQEFVEYDQNISE